MSPRVNQQSNNDAYLKKITCFSLLPATFRTCLGPQTTGFRVPYACSYEHCWYETHMSKRAGSTIERYAVASPTFIRRILVYARSCTKIQVSVTATAESTCNSSVL